MVIAWDKVVFCTRPSGSNWRVAGIINNYIGIKTMKRAGLLIALLLWGTSAYSMAIRVAVTGADMAGMEVTATFQDGTTDTAVWAATGMRSGAASGNGWTLSEDGDTIGECLDADCKQMDGVWTLENTIDNAIQSLMINAMAGDIVFDKFLDKVYTPGSNVGRTFLADDQTRVPDSAVYGDPVSDPDLFGKLTLTWENGFANGDSLRFMADTDAVPEPATLLLTVLGLLGFGFGARRKMS